MAKREQPATKRMEGARAVSKAAVTRELLWAAIGARIWPSYLAEPRKPQEMFPYILCIESPAGLLVYRVSDEELPMFERLERRGPQESDGCDKWATLHALAQDGWTDSPLTD